MLYRNRGRTTATTTTTTTTTTRPRPIQRKGEKKEAKEWKEVLQDLTEEEGRKK